MMKAYPEYKESGIKWLGEIPSDWDISKSKYLLNFNMGQSPDSNSVNQDGVGLPFIQGNAEFGTEYPTEKNYCTEPTKICNEGDLLISVRAPVGAMNIANKQFVIGRGLSAVTAANKIDRDFLWYSMVAQKEQLALMETGTTFKAVSGEDLKNIVFSLPSLDEQKAIAKGLKKEVGRVDNLIAEKQNFIKLLQEKRQALISHVVTKGLNPNVEMKDSGVEWIGEMPEHWDVTKLRYLGKCQNGINIDGDAFGSGYPFISYGDVYNNKALPNKVKGLVQSTEKDREVYSVKSGDVLFTRTSETIDEIGFTSACHNDMDNAVFAGFLIRFRPKENAIDPLYSEYYFQNEKLRAFFVKEMNLVTRASLSQELLKRMPVTIPPVEEQKEIAEYISNKDKLISTLVSEAKNSIGLLKEHRIALISAAVTGKIDVREMA